MEASIEPFYPGSRTCLAESPRRAQLSDSRRAAVQELLGRILELYSHGLNSEEIASRILDTEPQTALFLVSLLVEIILDNVPQQPVG